MSFVADLAAGEASEVKVAEVLKSVYPDCTWIKANKASKFLDLLCTEHGEAIEVKTDRKAATTGNVCFEANLFLHSRAQTVIYVLGDKAYSWPMADLKHQLLLLHAYGLTRSVFGGDRSANALILTKLEHIAPYAQVYELKEEE